MSHALVHGFVRNADRRNSCISFCNAGEEATQTDPGPAFPTVTSASTLMMKRVGNNPRLQPLTTLIPTLAPCFYHQHDSERIRRNYNPTTLIYSMGEVWGLVFSVLQWGGNCSHTEAVGQSLKLCFNSSVSLRCFL